MAAVAFTGMDEVMGFGVEWAFGYSPGRIGGIPSRRGSAFGMVGMNGSAAYADIDSGVAVAVMRNRFTAGDLLMTTVLRILRHTKLLAEVPVLDAYRLRCEERPAFRKALADQLAAFSPDP